MTEVKVKIHYSNNTCKEYTFSSISELEEFVYLEGDHVLYYEIV